MHQSKGTCASLREPSAHGKHRTATTFLEPMPSGLNLSCFLHVLMLMTATSRLVYFETCALQQNKQDACTQAHGAVVNYCSMWRVEDMLYQMCQFVTAGSHSLDKSTQEGASNSAVNQQSAVTSWLQTAQGAGHGGADQQGPRRMGGPACLGGMGNNPYPASCCAFSFRVILIQSCPTCTSVIADTDP